MSPTEPTGSSVRFGCGAALGLIAGLYVAGQVWLTEVGPFIATIIVAVLACG